MGPDLVAMFDFNADETSNIHLDQIVLAHEGRSGTFSFQQQPAGSSGVFNIGQDFQIVPLPLALPAVENDSPPKKEELIVDDIPIFERAFLNPCGVFVQNLFEGLFVFARKPLKVCNYFSQLKHWISICIHIRWLKWWCGWERNVYTCIHQSTEWGCGSSFVPCCYLLITIFRLHMQFDTLFKCHHAIGHSDLACPGRLRCAEWSPPEMMVRSWMNIP